MENRRRSARVAWDMRISLVSVLEDTFNWWAYQCGLAVADLATSTARDCIKRVLPL